MAAARSEGAERIIQDQLLPAVERAKAPVDASAIAAGGNSGGVLGAGPRQRRRAHLTLANFLADLYQRRYVCLYVHTRVCLVESVPAHDQSPVSGYIYIIYIYTHTYIHNVSTQLGAAAVGGGRAAGGAAGDAEAGVRGAQEGGALVSL
jgi:hypothetical protein